MRLGAVVGFLCAISASPLAVGDDAASGSGGQAEHNAEAVATLLHNRIAGVPPRAETLREMVELLQQQKNLEAALLATGDRGFYNLKLLSMFSVWANVAGDSSIPLNDMTATMIGMVRDDVPFKEVLYGDHIYLANANVTKTDSDYAHLKGSDPSGQDLCPAAEKPDGDKVIPPYLINSNDHYRCLQKYAFDLKDTLQHYKQSTLPRFHLSEALKFSLVRRTRSLPAKAFAGVLSTREFAKAYYSAGTNRRATAFVFKHFLCHEMEELHDTNISDEYVRRDVDRSPGDDPALFRKRCLGCHGGMDALSGWNVFYHYQPQLRADRPNSGNYLSYSASPMSSPGMRKINKNIAHCICKKEEELSKCKRGWSNVPSCVVVGHKPTDDSFVNLWAEGQNAVLGWRGETKGSGARAWGKMMAESKAFSSCMAKQVYENVCFVKPVSDTAQKVIDNLSGGFENNNYNMRKLFAATAVACLMEDS